MSASAPAPDAPSTDPKASAWEEPTRSAHQRGAPMLSAEGFEGPLDWLLEMARAQRIDLARLPIAALIASFAEALQAALAQPDGQALELPRWGDWLVMAATLTQLRSRLLLPAETPEGSAAVSQAESLRRQLVSRDQMRAASDWLERRPQLGREVQTRGRAGVARPGRSADLTELLRACLVVLRVPQELASAYQPQPLVFWRFADAAARIQEMLTVHPDGAALEDLVPGFAADAAARRLRTRAAVASTLVAGLELARGGALTLAQDHALGPVHVTAVSAI